jgi:hypothetical protein
VWRHRISTPERAWSFRTERRAETSPLLGVDTDAVMSDIWRYSDEEIATLKEQKVLY